MAIFFTCGCGKQLRTADENAGKRVKCPSCGQAIAVPAAAPSGGAKGSSSKSSASPPPARQPAPGMIRFGCGCGKQLQARAELAGRRLKCPGCRAELVVPRDAGIQATKPAAAKANLAAATTPAPKPKRSEPPPKFRDEDEEPTDREDENEEDVRPRAAQRRSGKKSPLPLILGSVAALLLLAGGGFAVYHFFLKGEDPGPLPQPGPPIRQTQLTPDLDLVPRDAVGFASVRLASLVNNANLQKLQPDILKLIPEEIVIQVQLRRMGLQPADVDRLTVVVLDVEKNSYCMLLGTNKPYDREKFLKEQAPDAREVEHGGKPIYVHERGPSPDAIHFFNDRLILKGTPDAVKALLDRPAQPNATGPLSEGLKLAAQDNHIVASMSVTPQMLAQMPKDVPEAAKPYLPLMELQTVTWRINVGDDLQVEGLLNYPDEGKAQKAKGAADDLLNLAQGMLPHLKTQFAQGPNTADVLKLFDRLGTTLKGVVINQEGALVRLSLKVDEFVPAASAALALAKGMLGDRAIVSVSFNNLKHLAFAMNNYHAAHGHFPIGVRDKDGQPLLSWRVELLPYLEQEELYKQFKLDEPWDSPHNMELLSKMPKVLLNPEHLAGKPGETFYQVFVSPPNTPPNRGSGAPFPDPMMKLAPGDQQTLVPAIPRTFQDGTTNTILIVEAGASVPWTKPADVVYDPKKPLPNLGDPARPSFLAAFADGAVRPLKRTLDQQVLRNLISPADGNAVPDLDK